MVTGSLDLNISAEKTTLQNCTLHWGMNERGPGEKHASGWGQG